MEGKRTICDQDYWDSEEADYLCELYDLVMDDGYKHRVPGTLEEELCLKNQKP
jgi:hypothetical protein